MVIDGMTAAPRSLDFRNTLIASISVLDGVAVSVVALDLCEAIRTLVLILDHVVVRGARHGYPPIHVTAIAHSDMKRQYLAILLMGIDPPIRRRYGTSLALRQQCM